MLKKLHLFLTQLIASSQKCAERINNVSMQLSFPIFAGTTTNGDGETSALPMSDNLSSDWVQGLYSSFMSLFP